MLSEIREEYQKAKAESKFASDPRERLFELLSTMLVDVTVPNIVLGFTLTATVQGHFGMVPADFVGAAWALWFGSVLFYMVADEVKYILVALAQSNDEEPEYDPSESGIE